MRLHCPHSYCQLQLDVYMTCFFLFTHTILQVADIIPQDVESSQTTKSPELSTTQDPQSGSCTQSPRPSNLLTPKEGGGLISMMANMPQVKPTGASENYCLRLNTVIIHKRLILSMTVIEFCMTDCDSYCGDSG